MQGHYFLKALVGHLHFETDVMFSRWLIEEAGVIPLPSSAFCMEPASAPKLVRLCFAKTPATLEQAGRRLGQVACTFNSARS